MSKPHHYGLETPQQIHHHYEHLQLLQIRQTSSEPQIEKNIGNRRKLEYLISSEGRL